MSLPRHLENYLGEIEAGWQEHSAGGAMSFQTARFPKGSGPGTVSFATLGLSHHQLPGKTKQIRQEFLMIVQESLEHHPVARIMQNVGEGVLGAHRALLRGDVVDFGSPLFRGSEMEALYVAIPVYFPDEFSVFKEDGKSIVIAWLVPIYRNEVNYIRANGWPAFEGCLVENDPDLTDVYRPPLPI
jgi:hypothetical protein